MESYATIAKASRIKTLDMIYRAGTSHIGSVFGTADIMAVLFEKIDFGKDIFIASKSWMAAMLYYHLWRRGRITQKELDSFCQPGSRFIGLVEGGHHPDIPFGVGSMGFGFPAAVGFALSKKMKGETGTVYCYMSDGEMQIGTTWEAALIAAHHKLDNLLVIVEINGLQAMGKTEDILRLGARFPGKWRAFDWFVDIVNGHDFPNIEQTLIKEFVTPLPHVLLIHTIKGKGVSFMEGENLWHYAQLKEDDYQKALQELNG